MEKIKKSGALDKIANLLEEEHWRKDASEIAFRVLFKLKENGMRQTDLARILGKTPQWVNRVCQGSENLTLGSIRKIEAALGITLVEIPELLGDLIPLERYDEQIRYNAEMIESECRVILSLIHI